MATVWITYAWSDNDDQDIDYVAERLKGVGLTVKLDRWNLQAGQHLWPQIERHICDPAESDAWVIFATEASLNSKACQEELALALDRALHQRGKSFPLIALSPATSGVGLFPGTLRTRLRVSLEDKDWLERVSSEVTGTAPQIPVRPIQPVPTKWHELPDGRPVLEVRPREGVWYPFCVQLPLGQREALVSIALGARGQIPHLPTVAGAFDSVDESAGVYTFGSNITVSPALSAFVFLSFAPDFIGFGQFGQQCYMLKRK